MVTLLGKFFKDIHDTGRKGLTRNPIRFFHIQGLPRLTSEYLEQAMRVVALFPGLPVNRISAHSLRYGGATHLASAGFPEFIIAQYGGWVYIRHTRETIDSVSRHTTSGRNANAEA